MRTIKENLEQAVIVAGNAYAPYSNFRVGCLIETLQGNKYTACNVENISYGLASCAERNAIFKAISEEGPQMRLKAVYVAMEDGKEGAPCGACRQVIAEFSDPEKTQVHFFHQKKLMSGSVAQLLPFCFRDL